MGRPVAEVTPVDALISAIASGDTINPHLMQAMLNAEGERRDPADIVSVLQHRLKEATQAFILRWQGAGYYYPTATIGKRGVTLCGHGMLGEIKPEEVGADMPCSLGMVGTYDPVLVDDGPEHDYHIVVAYLFASKC
jgi:hypothetical protein